MHVFWNTLETVFRPAVASAVTLAWAGLRRTVGLTWTIQLYRYAESELSSDYIYILKQKMEIAQHKFFLQTDPAAQYDQSAKSFD